MPYHHFTREERYIVSHMVLAGFSFRAIGRCIGKHHGSSREIKRNSLTCSEIFSGSMFAVFFRFVFY